MEVDIEAAGRLVAAFLQIGRRAIDLPDFNHRISDWFSMKPKKSSAQMSYLAHSWSNRVTDNDEVIVSVQRELVRIERALRHSGRLAH